MYQLDEIKILGCMKMHGTTVKKMSICSSACLSRKCMHVKCSFTCLRLPLIDVKLLWRYGMLLRKIVRRI